MPQCMCGRSFTRTTFDVENKDNDICPKCRDSSAPKSYINSYSWDCENVTGMVIDMSGNSGGSNFD